MSITFLTGPAGTGKTAYAVEHLRGLLTGSIPANSILVLAPQQTLTAPYRALLRQPTLPGNGAVDIFTPNGLAQRLVDLFWPLAAGPAGFARPNERPIFLTVETAQYYLRQAIEPLLQQGYFDPNVVPITISLPRLVSQILDNLNKAALMGLPHTEVGARLAASLSLEPANRVALEHAQACVNQFRDFCLARNLLDFSLRIETFYLHLWPQEQTQRYLTGHYRHLIVDNLEEDTPFAHTILRQWLPQTESALLVNDEEAGYRLFLGANPRTAAALADLSQQTIPMTTARVAPPDMLAFGEHLSRILIGEKDKKTPKRQSESASPSSSFTLHPSSFEQYRFYPDMIDGVVNHIAQLLAEGVPPGEIVVLAPFVSDALRFAFVHRMTQRGLPARSHRPSRPLSEEPAAKTMLTLARLSLGLPPTAFDLAQALHQAITGLDPVRATLLTQVVYRPQQTFEVLKTSKVSIPLTSFEEIEGEIRDRISYQAGLRFDQLRVWLGSFQADPSTPPVLDHFFNRLFEEVLSQPGFGFYGQPEAGEIVAHLIDSARQFRRVAEWVVVDADNHNGVRLPTTHEVNRAYLDLVSQGMLAAQYTPRREPAPDEAVLITPATTFLMSNRPVNYQFWLDAGSSGWWERIAQPLTHPYILAADWPPGRPWTDADEVAAQRDRLSRLVLGLTRRCRKQVIIVYTEIGEQGYEQRGQLLMVLQQMLRQRQREEEKSKAE